MILHAYLPFVEIVIMIWSTFVVGLRFCVQVV